MESDDALGVTEESGVRLLRDIHNAVGLEMENKPAQQLNKRKSRNFREILKLWNKRQKVNEGHEENQMVAWKPSPVGTTAPDSRENQTDNVIDHSYPANRIRRIETRQPTSHQSRNGGQEVNESGERDWVCRICTLSNRASVRHCQVCNTRRSPMTVAQTRRTRHKSRTGFSKKISVQQEQERHRSTSSEHEISSLFEEREKATGDMERHKKAIKEWKEQNDMIAAMQEASVRKHMQLHSEGRALEDRLRSIQYRISNVGLPTEMGGNNANGKREKENKALRLPQNNAERFEVAERLDQMPRNTSKTGTTLCVETAITTSLQQSQERGDPNKPHLLDAMKTISNQSGKSKRKSSTTATNNSWITNKHSRAFMRELEKAKEPSRGDSFHKKKFDADAEQADRSLSDKKRDEQASPNESLLWQDSPDRLPYQETVRCKATRQGLPCHDCYNCRRWYQMLKDTGHDFSQDPIKNSRHRSRFPDPETPIDFWEMSFIDEREKRKFT